MALDILTAAQGGTMLLLYNLHVVSIFLIIHRMCLIPCEISSSRIISCPIQQQILELPLELVDPFLLMEIFAHRSHHCDLDPFIWILYN